MQASKNTQPICELSKTLLRDRISSGDGLVNDGYTFHQFPVIGFNHHMQSNGGCQNAANEESGPILTAAGLEHDSDCSVGYNHTCTWDPSFKDFFFFDSSISIPMPLIREAIADIKKLNEASSQAMCGFAVYGGIWLRYISRSSAYLGQIEDAVVFEFFYYRSREENTPRLHEDLMEEMEQLLLWKYGGKPHWGKNRDVAFASMEERTLDLPKFLLVRDRFDPDGVFSSEWSDAILGMKREDGERRGVETVREHCALEGLCICAEDKHCALEMGYKCRDGHVFTAAKVCRFEGVNNTSENDAILRSTT